MHTACVRVDLQEGLNGVNR